MRRLSTVASVLGLCLLAAGLPVYAQGFDERLEGGYRSLRAGDAEGALALFRDLETDEPESDLVHYSLASVRYHQGMQELEQDSPEEAVARFSEARDSFQSLLGSPEAFVRRNALYNMANCSALMAKQAGAVGATAETVKAFEESVRAFEEVLRLHPEHEGARTNLDHMRFLLKSMLQDMPPEMQQPKAGEGDEDPDNPENPEEEENRGERSGEEGDKGERKDQPRASGDEAGRKAGDEKLDQGADSDPQMRENIEAILESLEDQDREEQRRLRRSKTPPRIRGDRWW